MGLAISFDEAKARQLRHEGDKPGVTGGTTVTPFFGSRHLRKASALPHAEELPDATLAQFDPGKVSRSHFHLNDQFQVLVDGKGRLGRHELRPYSIHFSRAYTPYGPLAADSNAGMTLFILRARPDPGSQRLPQERDQLLSARDRQPWQIIRTFGFPSSGLPVALCPISGLTDESGLAAYTLQMKPDTETFAPDPRHGNGQYLIVLKGGLLHDGRERNAYALVFTRPRDGPYAIRATAQGLEALVLNFPLAQSPQRAGVGAGAAIPSRTWHCALCSFTYDEASGLPADGIASGTRWEDVPENWSCPDCSAAKSDFRPA